MRDWAHVAFSPSSARIFGGRVVVAQGLVRVVQRLPFGVSDGAHVAFSRYSARISGRRGVAVARGMGVSTLTARHEGQAARRDLGSACVSGRLDVQIMSSGAREGDGVEKYGESLCLVLYMADLKALFPY